MKTIKQIAKEIGVSKQAVYKRYKGKLYKLLLPYVHIKNGITYISEQGEKILKKDFLKDNSISNRVYIDTHTEYVPDIPTVNQTVNQFDGEMALLYSMNNTLKEQLTAKDRQIEGLIAAINNTNIGYKWASSLSSWGNKFSIPITRLEIIQLDSVIEHLQQRQERIREIIERKKEFDEYFH